MRTSLAEPLAYIFPRVYQNIKERTGTPNLPFCLDTLNNVVHGFPKAPTIVSARTGMGKTSFMLQSALHLAKLGKNVIFLSLEDTKEAMLERLICQMNLINNWDLRLGKSEKIDYNETLAALEELPIYFDDSYGQNITEIRTCYDIINFNGKKADIIFLDYIQKLGKGGDHKLLEIITDDLREFSIKNVALVLGCQQNRVAAINGQPQLATAKNGGSIEETAELFLTLNFPFQMGIETGHRYEQEPYKAEFDRLSPAEKALIWKCYMEISVQKNKSGCTKHRIPIEYYGQHYFFKDYSKSLIEIVENQLHGLNILEQKEEVNEDNYWDR